MIGWLPDILLPVTLMISGLCSWFNLWLLLIFLLHNCSLHGQSIAMIVTDVFFSLIIIVFGWEHVLAWVIIVDFGECTLWGDVLHLKTIVLVPAVDLINLTGLRLEKKLSLTWPLLRCDWVHAFQLCAALLS